MGKERIELKQEDFKDIDFKKIKNIESVEVKSGKMIINLEIKK